jgi:hypothetical protein
LADFLLVQSSAPALSPIRACRSWRLSLEKAAACCGFPSQRGRVPSYTTTADGLPGDPVNLALIGTMPELRRAFETIDWSAADPLGLTSSWRMVGAFVLNRPYPRAPFSTLYLFGRGQDVGFQQPIGDSPRRRNHVRFWGLPVERAEQTIDTPLFWLDALRPADDERAVWLGAGTKDIWIFTHLA